MSDEIDFTGTHFTCTDCGKQVERGLWNWVEHRKNDCTPETKQAFANAHTMLANYGEYLRRHPDGVKLSETMN